MFRPTIACALTILLTAGCQSAGHGHGHAHHDAKKLRTGAGHGHSHGPGSHSHAAPKPARSRVAAMPVLAPPTGEVLQKRVEVAMEAHDFRRSLSLLRQLRRSDPGNLWARMMLCDALLESGRLDEAEAELQAVLDLKPCAAAYLRAGYLLHLRGETQTGIQVLELAVEAAATKTTEAWAHAELGDLLWHRGAVATAGRHYQVAARLDPTLARARVGQARVLAANEDLEGALVILRKAAFTPEHLSELAYLESALGHSVLAENALRRACLMSVVDSFHWGRQTASALADHGRGSAWGVELAEAELARRASPHGWDAYAWALHAAGKQEQAYRASKRALAEGTQEPLLLYHAAVIAEAAGHPKEARLAYERALALNPTFHIRFAARARAALQTLAPA